MRLRTYSLSQLSFANAIVKQHPTDERMLQMDSIRLLKTMTIKRHRPRVKIQLDGCLAVAETVAKSPRWRRSVSEHIEDEARRVR